MKHALWSNTMEPDDEIAQLLEVNPQPKVNPLKRRLSCSRTNTNAQAPFP